MRPWMGPADMLDDARTGALWALALLAPYLLAGTLWGYAFAIGATTLLEPVGATVGGFVGACMALGLWALRAARTAIAAAVLAAVLLLIALVP